MKEIEDKIKRKDFKKVVSSLGDQIESNIRNGALMQ